MASKDNSHLSKMDPEFAEVTNATRIRKLIADPLQFLKQASGPPPNLDGDIPAMRKMLRDVKRKMTEALLKDAKGVETEDLTVSARDGHQIPIRTYRPEGSTGRHPLVVFFHGGGFNLGGLENEELLCRSFVTETNVVVMNVDYRLAPEDIFPAAINDAWDVTKWVAANAGELKADLFEGFIVGGVSAGANLAAIVAHLSRDEKLSPPVTGSLLQVPLLLSTENIEEKYSAELKSYAENAEAPILNAKSHELMIKTNYNPDIKSHLFNIFAPPTNFSGLPPTVIQVAGMDMLRDEGLLYERLLREEHGTKTLLHVYPGQPHGFWSFFPEMKASKKLIADTMDGLKWLLDQV